MINENKIKKIHNICRIITVISLILTIIFFVYLIILGMLPGKYISILIFFIIILYSIFLIIIIHKKINPVIRILATALLLIVSIFLFLFGVIYIDKTIDFIDKIDNSVIQKENYYLVVSNDDEKNSMSELDNSEIGVYNTNLGIGNLDKALNMLNTRISFNSVKYIDLEEMLEDLKLGNVDAILINDSIIDLTKSDLSYLGLSIKIIDTISILVENIDIVKYVEVTNTPFNVYIAGSDSYGRIDKVTNTDVNIVITVDPRNNKVLITSIPRDYYVKLPNLNGMDKITHAGYYGTQTSVKAVEQLLDIHINYYAKVNFSTIKEVVDAIGGINIYNEFSFCMAESPEVCFNKGNIHLTGYRALMYARERKSFTTGDIQRVKNQQKILTAIIRKITSSSTIITNYSKILDSISNNFTTNMDNKSISKLVKKQLNDKKSWTIESQNLTGHDFYTTDSYSYPGMKLYVMKQDEKSLSKVKDKIKDNMT